MDAVLAMNFESRYLNLLERDIKDLQKELQANTELTNQVLDQAKHTNGRVTKAEAAIKKLQRRGIARFGINPNLLYIVATCLVLLLAIIAALLKVNIGRLLG